MKKTFYYLIFLFLKAKQIKKIFSVYYLLPILVLAISIFDNVYVLSLLNSLSYQIIIGLLSLSLILIFAKRYRNSLISFASASYLLATISVFDNQLQIIETIDDNISVSHFNVLRTNTDYDTIINSALESNSDIISFQEVNTDWAVNLLNKLSEEYPYRIIDVQDDNYFGIALFSKYQFTDKNIVYIEGVPNIIATINKDGNEINMITVHTNSPISKNRFDKRNNHIKELPVYLKEKNKSYLVIGDFNAVPWDSNIKKFKNETKLVDSRKSFSSTWPRPLGVLGIPLDYIFHSKNLECVSFSVINKSSSDHSGIKGVYNIENVQNRDKQVANLVIN